SITPSPSALVPTLEPFLLLTFARSLSSFLLARVLEDGLRQRHRLGVRRSVGQLLEISLDVFRGQKPLLEVAIPNANVEVPKGLLAVHRSYSSYRKQTSASNEKS